LQTGQNSKPMKKQPLPGELSALLQRFEQRTGDVLFLDAQELANWPQQLTAALTGQGLLERAEPAASVTCSGCEVACVMPVQVRPRADGAVQIFIACDKREDIGRIPVAPLELERWQVTPRTLANALAKTLGQTTAEPLTQALRLGWIDGAAGRAAVSLVTGADALDLVIAGHRVALIQLLRWDGKQLGLDMAALRRHAATLGGNVTAEAAEDRKKRLNARKAELVSQGVPNFLQVIAQEEGLSTARIKQLLAQKRRTASVFDGLGAPPPKRRTSSSPAKRMT
jgi:hypothetical protein